MFYEPRLEATSLPLALFNSAQILFELISTRYPPYSLLQCVSEPRPKFPPFHYIGLLFGHSPVGIATAYSQGGSALPFMTAMSPPTLGLQESSHARKVGDWFVPFEAIPSL